jgi:uncharacterized membrane protein
MQALKVFAIILPVFLVLDLVWLGVVMRSFYSAELGDLARREGTSLAPRWEAAILVYLLIPAGLVFFVGPLLDNNASLWKAFGWGAMYALVVYGVYDLTNLAVLERWSVRMTAADIAWGAALCGTVSVVMRLAIGWLSK